jgi:hypothetical protein
LTPDFRKHFPYFGKVFLKRQEEPHNLSAKPTSVPHVDSRKTIVYPDLKIIPMILLDYFIDQ